MSLIRSAVTSRSNCAKDSNTLRVNLPILVAVLKDWVTETKAASAASSVSTILEKSAKETLEDQLSGMISQMDQLTRDVNMKTEAIRYLEIQKNMLLRYKDEYELITNEYDQLARQK